MAPHTEGGCVWLHRHEVAQCCLTEMVVVGMSKQEIGDRPDIYPISRHRLRQSGATIYENMIVDQ